jgi:ankyrin repeat protein
MLSIKHAFSAINKFNTKSNTKQSGKINPKKAFSKDEYNLYKSVYMGRTNKVKKLIDSGVNVNVHSPNSHRTPLHLAASKGKMEMVKILVENGANLEATNSNDKTPLYSAIENSKIDIIKYLKSKGAKITQDMLNKSSENIKSILIN